MKKKRYNQPDMYAVRMDTLPLMLGGSTGDDISGGSVTPPGVGGGGSGSRSYGGFGVDDEEDF